MSATITLRLPPEFRRDRESRGLDVGDRRADKRVLRITVDGAIDYLDDAAYYCDPWGPDLISGGLKRSAYATVAAIKKQAPAIYEEWRARKKAKATLKAARGA